MVSTQVVIGLVKNSPIEASVLDDLADAALDALNRDARFLAFGPVVSVNYARHAVEVECTVCSDDGSEADIQGKMDRIAEIVRNALAAAEYATSAERIPVPA